MTLASWLHLQVQPARMLTGLATLVVCGLPLAACTTTKEIVLPVSGINSRVYIVDCSGASLTWSHCYRKAGETCPLGYKVLDNSYKHGDGIVAGDVLQLAGNNALHRRMVIDCRAPGKADASAAPGDGTASTDPSPAG